MRKNLFNLLLLFSVVIISSCSKDYLIEDNPNYSSASLSDARETFESTATELRQLDFNISNGVAATKSSDRAVVAPDWNKATAIDIESGKFTIFEVPLKGDLNKFALTRMKKDDILRRVELKTVNTRLILKRNNEKGKYLYFIVTMIGHNEDKKEVKYTKNNSFTGQVFISNLEGKCLEVYNSNAGVRRRVAVSYHKLNVPKTKATKNIDTDSHIATLVDIDNKIITSIIIAETPEATYSMGETNSCIQEGECSFCNAGFASGNPGFTCDDCGACSMDIPDVNVQGCSKCHGTKPNCYCCTWCNDYPCSCYTQPDYGCDYCGSYSCSGGCQTACYRCGSRYCNGNCGGGGGGNPNPNPDPDPNPCPHCGSTSCDGECQEYCKNAKCSKCNGCYVYPSCGVISETCTECTCTFAVQGEGEPDCVATTIANVFILKGIDISKSDIEAKIEELGMELTPTGLEHEQTKELLREYFGEDSVQSHTSQFNYKNVLSNGKIIITNILTSPTQSHVILVVGYQEINSNVDYVCIDPKFGTTTTITEDQMNSSFPSKIVVTI